VTGTPALCGIDYESTWLLVVNLTTGKAWRVAAALGYAIQYTTWTLDDTWLYFGERLPGVNHDHYLQRIRRIRLTELDSWGKATK
jgi:starvation-inducible outer membrane lipoprotein